MIVDQSVALCGIVAGGLGVVVPGVVVEGMRMRTWCCQMRIVVGEWVWWLFLLLVMSMDHHKLSH